MLEDIKAKGNIEKTIQELTISQIESIVAETGDRRIARQLEHFRNGGTETRTAEEILVNIRRSVEVLVINS